MSRLFRRSAKGCASASASRTWTPVLVPSAAVRRPAAGSVIPVQVAREGLSTRGFAGQRKSAQIKPLELTEHWPANSQCSIRRNSESAVPGPFKFRVARLAEKRRLERPSRTPENATESPGGAGRPKCPNAPEGCRPASWHDPNSSGFPSRPLAARATPGAYTATSPPGRGPGASLALAAALSAGPPGLPGPPSPSPLGSPVPLAGARWMG
jgi:hypothetical protein